jgi:hypothetical protein
LPAIENPATYQLRVRDSVLGLGDLEGILEKNGVAGVLLEHGGSLRILGPDPRHRAFTVDLLEPDKRIVACGAAVGTRCAGEHHGADDGNYRGRGPHVGSIGSQSADSDTAEQESSFDAGTAVQIDVQYIGGAVSGILAAFA